MSETSKQTVEFSIDEINQILSVLGKIPAEYSMNLIMFIKQTAENQLGPVQGESEESPSEA